MIESQKPGAFQHIIVSVEDQPRIYISPRPTEPGPAHKAPPSQEPRREHARERLSFFGHRIATLLFSKAEKPKSEEQEKPLLSLEEALQAGLESVKEKLEKSRQAQRLRKSDLAGEESKHARFIQDRNHAQETLFAEVVRLHSQFGTGLDEEALWRLHDSLVKLCEHEASYAAEDTLHQHLESNVLHFLRRKALETAWGRIEEAMERFNMPFPIPSSVESHKDPVHKQEIRREARTIAKEAFMKLPPDQLAELILANVPAWVYAYPSQESYLWRLTALQSVAAGVAADFLMRALGVWEKESPRILKEIEREFMQRLDALRKKGETAIDLAEIHAVAVALRRISAEEIPEHIWKHLEPALKEISEASKS